ncbi:MAG: BspA family leucine-rich repeat surface protein, partial [Flavobacteriaceae bacterium]|nr:BspA family leucine-rich repeat surface protein [Flavobacteriaceae bacterium]
SKSINTATFTASKNCSISVSFEKLSYTITTSAGDGGSITSNQNVNHGESVSISATPNTGYQIASWSGNCGTFEKSTSIVRFTASKNCSVSVSFEKSSYTISTSAGNGGTITSNQNVQHGESASISATPNTGYQIASWSGNCGNFDQSTNPVSFTASKNCSISVSFEKTSYTITTSAGNGGTITPNQNIKDGESVSITAKPNTGYQIASWSGNCGNFDQSTNPVSFTASKNCSISVSFEKTSYTITTSTGNGGTITPNQNVIHGESVNITATPNDKYQIKAWSGTCGTFSKSTNTATFTASKSCSLSVSFEKVSYTINTNAGTGGSITPNQNVIHGESVSITAKPNTGYQIASWSGNCGTFSSSDNPVRFTASKNCSINVSFEKLSYTITTSASDGGTISAGIESVEHGQSVSITATPSTNYEISSWSGSCGNFSNNRETIQFTATKSCSVGVHFDKVKYFVFTVSDIGGTITAPKYIKHGEQFTVTAYPKPDSTIYKWTGDCGTFSRLSNSVTITVTSTCYLGVRWLIPSENFIELDSNGVTIKVKSGLSQRDVVGREAWIDYGGENGVVDYLIVDDFMLKQRISLGKSVDKIVTTYVTNMNGLFRNKYLFNEDISTWDTSNVISMNSMFNQASAFNRDIGNWDVSKVIDMRNMFREAHNFNQNIGGWNVSNVTLMNGMFSNYDEGGRFNQDISTWNVSNVTDMNSMFNGSTNFNQNLSGWNVTNVFSCASFSSNSKLVDNHKPRFTNCEE